MAMKKELRKLEIEPAENGGHHVTHNYKDMPTHSSKSGLGSAYVEPDHHDFGADEGHKMLAHVANALCIPESEGGGDSADKAIEKVKVRSEPEDGE